MVSEVLGSTEVVIGMTLITFTEGQGYVWNTNGVCSNNCFFESADSSVGLEHVINGGQKMPESILL